MSADTSSITLHPSDLSPSGLVELSPRLSATERQRITALLDLLPSTDSTSKQGDQRPFIIRDLVDGRGLACPMPLLKTKVALRHVAVGESLYVVATDPNSRADIKAFCDQSQSSNAANLLSLNINVATAANGQSTNEKTAETSFDTIYHFIITKIDSN